MKKQNLSIKSLWWQNYMPIGLQKTIEKHIKFSLVMVFYLIMKVQGEVRLCPKKIISALCRIKEGKQKKLFLGNEMQKEIGDMLELLLCNVENFTTKNRMIML